MPVAGVLLTVLSPLTDSVTEDAPKEALLVTAYAGFLVGAEAGKVIFCV